MLRRIRQTADKPLGGFPHYADTETGIWTVTPDGDWTGGFWVGLLWLAYLATRQEQFRIWANQWSAKLLPRSNSETVFRCFLFYYGGAIGDILFGDDASRETGLLGAEGLMQQYNPDAGLIPLGTKAEEASSVGKEHTNIDSSMSIALLGWAGQKTGNSKLLKVGVQHARKHIELCIRPDGSVCQSASFDPKTGRLLYRYTHKGLSDTSTWARAQAWAMLGYSMATKWAPETGEFLEAATKVTDWWIKNCPKDYVAFWDFDDPQIPQAHRDTSATAIAVASMLKLAPVAGARGGAYRAFAERTVETLVRDYLTPTSPNDTRPAGILTSGCYDMRRGLATNHELVWGSYFLFEALQSLIGRLDPRAI